MFPNACYIPDPLFCNQIFVERSEFFSAKDILDSSFIYCCTEKILQNLTDGKY